MIQIATMFLVFMYVYETIKLFVRRKERIMIINKLSENSKIDLPEDFGILSENNARESKIFSSLKWGLLIVGLGLGLIMGYILLLGTYNAEINHRNFHNNKEIIYMASSLTMGGLGVLISFLIELNYYKKKK